MGAVAGFEGHGLEIGGPSEFFRIETSFPIYGVAASVDNVNYSTRTFWEGSLQEGNNFKYDHSKEPGYQFICEASELSPIPDGKYDFVASCHTLEHCANPIKALYEWRRVLKDDGWLALVLPHKAGTFDHRRMVTEFEHLLKDYRDNVTEDDETHFGEILEKHDLRLDPGQKSRADFEKWIQDNPVTRGAHHHVFDPGLAIALVDYAGFEVVTAQVTLPFHIFIVAQKSSKSAAEKEKARNQILQNCRARSPFKSDRRKFGLADACWVSVAAAGHTERDAHASKARRREASIS
jgi:SAM-dependent methyltransferase